jgi:hypothetical protein
MEQQRSLSGYKSKINEGTDFENPNVGKTTLSDSDEYVFRLTAFPKVRTFQQIKQMKDGSTKTVSVDKAICEFEEETTHNIVVAFFRVDSINFSEDESYESGVVKFFRKIKTPLIEGIEPDWEKMFIVGMRFRSRVVIAKGQDKLPNGNYYLDIPTCRPILPSDKHPEAVAATTDPTTYAPETLTNALLLAKGAHDHTEALQKLKNVNASKEVVMAFFNASMEEKIKYPIA